VLADRYELVRHIARGGMGDVYEADDHQLRRSVAVKVFRAGATGDRARFDREVVVLAALNHPGLVRVYDAGEHAGDAFVVLELVDGPTLATRLATDGSVPSAEVADVGASLAAALAYVHEHGVVHRDVTPANVICGADGRPRLADFGIARLIDSTRVTAASTAIGTAAYMAPEQVQGHDVTPAADVYALGLVLLELLTGRRGFTGPPSEVTVARLVRRPDMVGVPGAWVPLLAAMTGRVPANRPTAAAVRDQLAALLAAGSADTGAVAVVPEAVASDEPTEPLEAVAAGGTTVMPVALVPDDDPPALPAALPSLRRWALVAAVVGLVLLLAVTMGGSGGGIEVPTSTTVTQPVVANPTTTINTTTTSAPATPAPPPAPGGKKKEPKHERGEPGEGDGPGD
jgi:serine/threonine protein kinase